MNSVTEKSDKFQKIRYWKEKSVEDVVRLEGLPFNSSMISFHIWLFKKSIHRLQNNVHMLSFLILQWVHTWANSTRHTSLSMKEGCLFVLFVLMGSTQPGCFRSCSWSLWKALKEEGCIGLISWCLDLRCKRVLEYWMISLLKIKS